MHYAAGYDPDVSSAGGSSYDNQALFDFRGNPLDSLDVFTRIYPKNEKFPLPSEPVSEHVTEPDTAGEPPAEPEPPRRWPGDLDGDDELTVFDLALLKRAVQHPDSLDDAQRLLCDLDDSGSINERDILLLQDYLHGRQKSFPAGRERCMPELSLR